MVPNITTAVCVVKLLTVLADKSDSKELYNHLRKSCVALGDT